MQLNIKQPVLAEGKGELAGIYLLGWCSHPLCGKQVNVCTESRRLFLAFFIEMQMGPL